jgi:hypothetical protein
MVWVWWDGALQTDRPSRAMQREIEWPSHGTARAGLKMIHARQPFHELVVAKDVRATPALLLFQDIYKVEAKY